jgi:general stress protein 26
MDVLRRFCLVLAVAFAPMGASLSAQTAPAQLDSVARRIVAAARYATFITIDGAGQPQARTVDAAAPDSGWNVWVATNPRTRKVREVERQSRVALHYFDATSQSYVAVTGRARVVRDRQSKDAHWNPAWTPFYKNRDTDVVLIVVQATKVEVVSPAMGVDNDPVTWLPQSFAPRSSPTTRRPVRPVR